MQKSILVLDQQPLFKDSMLAFLIISNKQA